MARSRWKKQHHGQTLRSGFEVKVAKSLDEQEVPYEYETLKISYKIPESTHTYKPDFQLPNGIIIEAKGNFSPADRRKMALVIEQHPEMDIRMLFMLDNKISKSSKTSYTDWCNKRSIKCAVSKTGEVPTEWVNENKENSIE